jgi:hypothetical protein
MPGWFYKKYLFLLFAVISLVPYLCAENLIKNPDFSSLSGTAIANWDPSGPSGITVENSGNSRPE